MATLSRTEKYKKLRQELQNDNGSEISTPELSRIEKRLNRIDSNNFAKPQEYGNRNYDAAHARTPISIPEKPAEKPEEPLFDLGLFKNDTYTSRYDNDYLDQYIREVKQYNIDQGNAVSDNTQVNILRNLNDSAQGRRPVNTDSEKFSEKRTVQERDEPENPFVGASRQQQPSYRYQSESYAQPSGGSSYADDRTESLHTHDDTITRSREDIMAEVQMLVNGGSGSVPSASSPSPKSSPKSPGVGSERSPFRETFSMPGQDPDHRPQKKIAKPDNDWQYVGTDTFNRRMDEESKVRQQLLHETTQMRAQLDGYEDNLTEVSDKMRYTNKILNTVLIVLIVALVVILMLLIYWILTAGNNGV